MPAYTYFVLVLASIFLFKLSPLSGEAEAWTIFKTIGNQTWNSSRWPNIVKSMKSGKGLQKILSSTHYHYIKQCRIYSPWVSKLPKTENVTEFGVLIYSLSTHMYEQCMKELCNLFSNNYFIEPIYSSPYIIRFRLKKNTKSKTITNIRTQITNIFKTYEIIFLSTFQMRADFKGIIESMDRDYSQFHTLCDEYYKAKDKKNKDSILEDMSVILNKYESKIGLVKNKHSHNITSKKYESKQNRVSRVENHITQMRNGHMDNEEVFETTFSK